MILVNQKKKRRRETGGKRNGGKKSRQNYSENRTTRKIADTLLKRGTKQHADGWDASGKTWAHMVLHLSHTEGGFTVTLDDITIYKGRYFLYCYFTFCGLAWCFHTGTSGFVVTQ